MNFVKMKLSIYRPIVLATPMLINSHVKSVNYVKLNGKQHHVDYIHCEKNLVRMRCTAIRHAHTMVHAPNHAHAFNRRIIVKNSVAATMIVRIVFLVAIAEDSAIQIIVPAILHYVNVIRICVIVVLNKSMMKKQQHVKMYAFNENSINIY